MISRDDLRHRFVDLTTSDVDGVYDADTSGLQPDTSRPPVCVVLQLMCPSAAQV